MGGDNAKENTLGAVQALMTLAGAGLSASPRNEGGQMIGAPLLAGAGLLGDWRDRQKQQSVADAFAKTLGDNPLAGVVREAGRQGKFTPGLQAEVLKDLQGQQVTQAMPGVLAPQPILEPAPSSLGLAPQAGPAPSAMDTRDVTAPEAFKRAQALPQGPAVQAGVIEQLLKMKLPNQAVPSLSQEQASLANALVETGRVPDPVKAAQQVKVMTTAGRLGLPPGPFMKDLPKPEDQAVREAVPEWRDRVAQVDKDPHVPTDLKQYLKAKLAGFELNPTAKHMQNLEDAFKYVGDKTEQRAQRADVAQDRKDALQLREDTKQMMAQNQQFHQAFMTREAEWRHQQAEEKAAEKKAVAQTKQEKDAAGLAVMSQTMTNLEQMLPELVKKGFITKGNAGDRLSISGAALNRWMTPGDSTLTKFIQNQANIIGFDRTILNDKGGRAKAAYEAGLNFFNNPTSEEAAKAVISQWKQYIEVSKAIQAGKRVINIRNPKTGKTGIAVLDKGDNPPAGVEVLGEETGQ